MTPFRGLSIMFAFGLVLTSFSQNAWSQSAGRPPGSMAILQGMTAAEGSAVLNDKGCTKCHSFDNWGEMFGPDLGSNRIRGQSPASLAAAMWNQAPSMWKSIGTGEISKLAPKEAAAMFAFFYSRLYFDTESESPRGEDLFRARCSACHDLKAPATSTKTGPPAASWGRIKDPIALAGRMWNHTSYMLDQTGRQGRSWPKMSGQDFRNLLSYLWRMPELTPLQSAFAFGDDAQGRTVFDNRCANCHTLDRKEPGRVDLSRLLRQPTMLQFSASMWNHAPAMKRKNPGTALPVLSESEMRDLVTYLVVGRSFEAVGHPRFGERVYRAKNCETCHTTGVNVSGAPALGDLRGPFDPVRMTSVLWSHGPQMLKAMKDQNLKWPRFDARDMLDLIAYLNEKAAPPPR